MREDRVGELREQVAAGTYRVNANAVATAMLTELAGLEATDVSEA